MYSGKSLRKGRGGRNLVRAGIKAGHAGVAEGITKHGLALGMSMAAENVGLDNIEIVKFLETHAGEIDRFVVAGRTANVFGENGTHGNAAQQYQNQSRTGGFQAGG